MPRFDIHTAETAPDSKAVLEGVQATYGFVPNLIGTMAESPALAEGYVTLAKVFDTTDLSPTERQVILMTNNRLNGCQYCMSAHSTISKMQGVPDDVVDALRRGVPLADAKLDALRVFAERINETRGWPEAGDIDALLAAGYTRRTVFDVVLGTAVKVLSNYTNHIAETPLDAPFVDTAWTPDELAEPAAS